MLKICWNNFVSNFKNCQTKGGGLIFSSFCLLLKSAHNYILMYGPLCFSLVSKVELPLNDARTHSPPFCSVSARKPQKDVPARSQSTIKKQFCLYVYSYILHCAVHSNRKLYTTWVEELIWQQWFWMKNFSMGTNAPRAYKGAPRF